MTFLLSIVTNPRVLIALAISAALAYSHFKAYRTGAGKVQAQWTAAIERDKLAAARAKLAATERNHERQEAAQADTIANESKLRQEIKNAQTARARLVDDLVAGRVRIRPLNDAGGNATVSPSTCTGMDAGAITELQRRVAETMAIADSCQAERDAAVRETVVRTRAVNQNRP